MKRKLILSLLLVFVMTVSASAFSGHEKWRLNLDSPVTSGIAVSGNTVFAGSETGRFYAVNKNSGRVIWEYKVGNTIYGTPSIIGNRVVFAQGNGQIVCLNISDGSFIWAAGGTENNLDTYGRAVNDGLSDGTSAGSGLVYVSKDDRKVHAYSDRNGREAWTYTTGDQGVRAAPIFANGLVFVGEYDGIFSILDAKTGRRLNGGGAGGAVNTPSVSSGNVYFSAWDGSVNAVQIKDVIPLWNVNVRDSITTQPEINSGKIVVGTGRGQVVALSQRDGRTLWRFNTNTGSISAKPVIADGLVFAGAETGNIFVLDAGTGRHIATLGEGNGIVGNPAYSDGVFYFGSAALYAYE